MSGQCAGHHVLSPRRGTQRLLRLSPPSPEGAWPPCLAVVTATQTWEVLAVLSRSRPVVSAETRGWVAALGMWSVTVSRLREQQSGRLLHRGT